MVGYRKKVTFSRRGAREGAQWILSAFLQDHGGGPHRGGQAFSDDDARHAKSAAAALTDLTGRNYAKQTGPVRSVGRKVPQGLRI